MENKFEKIVDEIVKKWTNVTEYALHEKSPMDYSRIHSYYEQTPEVIALRKCCKALEIINEKNVDIKHLKWCINFPKKIYNAFIGLQY